MLNIWHYLLISLGLNILMFIPAFIFKTDKLTDLSYALSFIALAIISLILGGTSSIKLLLAGMVILWGIRLGAFLFIRIRKQNKDKRFDGIRESFPKFLQFWVLQGLSVWVIMLPALFFISTPSLLALWPGFLIWVIGLSVETISDLQKYRFTQNPKNKGKFISSGLWKYSRHPNYFGEILCWIGVYIFAFASLAPLQKLTALASPLYIIVLLIFVTGLPLLEKSADSKWGSQKTYQEYKRKTSVLIPWVPKK